MLQRSLQIALFFAVLLAITPLLGGYMARVYSGERVVLSPVLGLLRRNLLVYGVGGLIAPFVGIKLLDLVIHNLLGA